MTAKTSLGTDVILFDTAHIVSMMVKLQNANEEINRALDILNSVVTHDSWACKERTVINDYILDNRRKIQRLQSSCDAFTNVAKNVLEEFIAVEKKIPHMFENVDVHIARILADPVVRTTINGVVSTSKAAPMIKNCKTDGLRSLFR